MAKVNLQEELLRVQVELLKIELEERKFRLDQEKKKASNKLFDEITKPSNTYPRVMFPGTVQEHTYPDKWLLNTGPISMINCKDY
ncbi:hypothetical protein LAh8_106 [Aeromonas phage LAh_8]|uniref:Uncharacterized protein n=2 Tax=Lahexavirus TaxID=2843411 RepID=A0A514A015_9CAUD|nr:hypothetical protein HWC30_gp048 [Aeromonas phage LAh_6]YP_009847445.1 hypothetical protein HWC31_gp107 [Aeromonas phage LAh_8]QDH46582.1 hypothetical protein LAh6_48 [Aeromonas phage LAh_6]QDH46819.1 hypothetical protein LAh8_106 [Aeromonas phage LAh_8]